MSPHRIELPTHSTPASGPGAGAGAASSTTPITSTNGTTTNTKPNGADPTATAPDVFSANQPRRWLMGDEAFERVMPHHSGMRALWETKWKFPCTKSLYPFHDGAYEDFAPVFEQLIADGVDDGTAPAYTRAFFPAASALEERGDAAMKAGDKKDASDLYLRAACVLRIARFPYVTAFPDVSCPEKWRAWEWQKRVYLKAGQSWDEPVVEVDIPHVHAQGRDREVIPAYVRVPDHARVLNTHDTAGEGEEVLPPRFPAVLLFTGLDGYRPDNTVRCDEFLSRGWAAVVVEIPGTADCPADPADPTSPDRLWDSVLSWMAADGRFDMSRVLVWGLSAGGYYAVRVAHTHKDKIRGAVAQGAGVHHFFDADWMDRADGHEYPFVLSPAFAMKHGFESVEAYKAGVQRKFSLLETGIIQKPSCRLLLVNGTLDGLMPIEDSMMLFEYGSPKEARFFSNALHMGYPLANSSVYPWMEEVMGYKKD
ncbi:Hybrid PKS-NRPS synthetase lepA [Apiospora arundinis]